MMGFFNCEIVLKVCYTNLFYTTVHIQKMILTFNSMKIQSSNWDESLSLWLGLLLFALNSLLASFPTFIFLFTVRMKKTTIFK